MLVKHNFLLKKTRFVSLHVAIMESWLRHFTPKSSRQSTTWIAHNVPNTKCLETQQYVWNIIATD